MNRQAWLLLMIGVLLALGSPVRDATAAPLISVIGSSSRTLDFPNKPAGKTTLVYPVSVVETNEQESIDVQLIRLTLDGRDLETSPSWLTHKPGGMRQGRGNLVFSIPGDKLYAAGTYTLTVEFWKTSVAKPAEASKSDKENTKDDTRKGEPVESSKKTISDQGSLTVSVVRPAGTLDVGAPLKIERTIYMPAFIGNWLDHCLDTCLTPGDLMFVETSGRNAVQIGKAAGMAKAAIVRLRTDANSGEVSRLTASLPAEIPAGVGEKVTLKLSAPTPIGAAAGTLQFTSEQLQPREFSVPVEVFTRLSRIWLIIVIICGILFGTITRTWLEKRKLKNRARAALLRVSADYRDAIDRISDKVFQGKLSEKLTPVTAILGKKSAKEAELTDAANTGSTALETILTEYETARSEVETTIATTLTDLGDISSAASLILQASEVADLLNSVEQKLETGAVTDAKKQIDQNLPTRLHKLKSMLTERANALKTNLDKGGTWPEADRDGVLDDAKTKVTTFLTTHGDRNANAVDLGGSLRDFDLLIRLLRPRLADFRAEAIRKLSSKVRDGLVDIPVVTKSAQIANLTRAIEEFEKAAGAANGAELLETLMRKEEELRDELAAALGFASKSVQQPKDKPDGLDAHRYREAMNDVRVREGLGALGKPGAPVTPSGAVPLPPDADDVMGAKRFGHFQIISRSEIRVGTPTVFAVDPVQPLGGPTVDDMKVAWWINGKAIESSGNSGMNCRYTANASERELEVRVRITVQGANVQVDQEVTQRFLVMQRVGRDLADALEEEADRIGVGQTVIAGVLITLAGYSIFQGTFVGSLADVIAALFWGFAVDVTVAKAQEYGAPLLARQPKFPPAG